MRERCGALGIVPAMTGERSHEILFWADGGSDCLQLIQRLILNILGKLIKLFGIGTLISTVNFFRGIHLHFLNLNNNVKSNQINSIVSP